EAVHRGKRASDEGCTFQRSVEGTVMAAGGSPRASARGYYCAAQGFRDERALFFRELVVRQTFRGLGREAACIDLFKLREWLGRPHSLQSFHRVAVRTTHCREHPATHG